LYAFGDEGSNSVWLWDLVSRAKTQSLIPHHSPVLDIRSVHTAGADILGCISERTLQVYRRLPP
jgi:E3 ubiquitin-protein ligase RFWD3